ncbi:hypothetical protein C8R46DRAFT_1197971 [Mycena filopes]|nr:hypothetical protein C8R46DRAFT_1197971 [Mycena filopes]
MRGLWPVLSLLQLVAATLVNVTVDDLNGGSTGIISYFPDGAWISGSVGGCSDCRPLAISGIAYMDSFHGSLFNQKSKGNQMNPPTATLTFSGTSVSVNCILSNGLSNPSGSSDMTFILDGVQAGSFLHTPTGAPGFEPSTVFVSTSLLPGTHTLLIKNGRPGGGSSLTILDSISYSFDDLTSTTSVVAAAATGSSDSPAANTVGATTKTSNAGAIAGGVIGALAIVLLVALALLYIRHRKNQHRSNVPLVTSLSGPIDRLRCLFSAQGSSSRPPPDMAPVPYPSPATNAAFSPAPRPPPPSTPPPTSLSSGPPAPRSRASRISFNANLLVGRFQRRPPPPSAFVSPGGGGPVSRHLSAPHPHPAAPASPGPVPLVRQTSAPPAVVSSIQAWQRRTQEATAREPAPIIHPLDMSEVDLSSHYDESSISGPPPAPPPPPPVPAQPPQRRFTVMNN